MKARSQSIGSPLAAEILEYLKRHPNAKDTLEGITHWWLLEQRIQHTIPEVEGALTELVEQGLVQQHQQRDGRICYRRSRQPDDESGCNSETQPAKQRVPKRK